MSTNEMNGRRRRGARGGIRARVALPGLGLVALFAAACSSGSGGNDGGPCVPKTCRQIEGSCGDLDDGCQGTVTCTCGTGQSCTASNRCVAARDGGAQDGGANQDGGADGGAAGPLIGSACATTAECADSGLTCVLGFCSKTCHQTSDCNGALAASDGPFGGYYGCFPLGAGLVSYCWPNGSGQSCGRDAGACPRTGEGCAFTRCQYVNAGTTTPRTNMRCYREADCMAGESCALYTNLDQPPDLRTEGVCLWRGDAAKKAPGEACQSYADCASGLCTPHASGQSGVCAALCRADTECASGQVCLALGVSERLSDYTRQYVGACQPWDGSGRACAAHADCPAGESCSQHPDFASDTALRIKARCKRTPIVDGGIGGARCDADAQCASGLCVKSALSGVGTCSGTCFAGDGECAAGTSCRPRVINSMNPATTDDDLSVPQCGPTGVGAPCGFQRGCRRCASDADCFTSIGMSCAADGICRDGIGRCAEPCRTGCAQDGGLACASGSTCRTTRIGGRDASYCADSAGNCVRVTPPQDTIIYEHGRCGDPASASPQQDLCYFYGRRIADGGVTDIFACGEACPAGACPSIETVDGGPLQTVCRTVYEFGVATDGGFLFSAAPMSPQQCAPSSAFVGRPSADAGPPSDGGAGDGGAAVDGGVGDGGM